MMEERERESETRERGYRDPGGKRWKSTHGLGSAQPGQGREVQVACEELLIALARRTYSTALVTSMSLILVGPIEPPASL